MENATVEQLSFDWLPLVQGDGAGTIQERFEEFHRLNPHVYRILCRLARNMRRAGHSHYGMKTLWETMRYHSSAATLGEGYRLNNNFTSRHARLIMDQEPDLAGFFEVRELKAR